MRKYLQKLIEASKSTKLILLGYIVIVVAASIHPFFLGDKGGYKHYNNYVIFKQSFFHLIHHKDLYILYLDEQWDLFKYSPAFALFMGVFAWMPDMMGATGWNLLNALVLFFSIHHIPQLAQRPRQKMLLFVFLEMLTSIQNFQSNALLAGLIVYAFSFFERRNVWLASLCIVLTVFIKLFGIVAFALFLFYPEKIKFVVASVLWVILLFILPVVVLPWAELQAQYASWGRMLSEDHSVSHGLSVMGWFDTWFGLGNLKNVIVAGGVLLFCIPLFRFALYKNAIFRLLILASVLLWMVIFNHKAESPTFVIAVTGVAIWYFSQQRTTANFILLSLVFVFTCLSPTDLFPRAGRTFVGEYALKAVPCIFVWFKLLYDLMQMKKEVSLSKSLS
ncbi:MAG TPA: glycosyltransferase family 87 protein [Flavipsychrobacter sp.]|nr:glycosyltransferase family 87 protein [Flavipsychrobacter sp.]